VANKRVVTINVGMIADGVSTTFSFNLIKDPYSLDSGNGGNLTVPIIGEQINWFTNSPRASVPTGVLTPVSAQGQTYDVSLADNVVTLTFTSAPPAGGYSLPVYLTY